MAGILLSVTVEEAAVRRLEALPGVAVRAVKPEGRDWGVSDDLARGVEVLLCKYPPRNLADLADLKVLQLSTVGYEHLRHLGLADRPLRVCNARGVFDTAIAEWNLAMMVNLARDLRAMARNQEQGRWDRDPRFQQEVRGRVVGLWGYGGIGRETARLAKAFGLTVHALTRARGPGRAGMPTRRQGRGTRRACCRTASSSPGRSGSSCPGWTSWCWPCRTRGRAAA